jgi:hypothetical protein
MASIDSPVSSYGTQFYRNGQPYLRRSQSSTSTVDPYYGFHGTLGPFSTGVSYTFETSLGGGLDYGFEAGFEHVSIIIPFKLSKHYGNPLIALGPISGGLISTTTPCGQTPGNPVV